MTRQLPGVSFDQLHRPTYLKIDYTFDSPAIGSVRHTPQLIFPGQRLQALASLGSYLRGVLDGKDADELNSVLSNLNYAGRLPQSLRRPDMKRQQWRLQDLRDGGGFGYTVELFFLTLKQLLSISSLPESGIFYVGTFRSIASHSELGRQSLGTQLTLLNIICDLTIEDRGPFSDFSYPESITTMLFDMLDKMLPGNADAAIVDAGNADTNKHIRDAVKEIKSSYSYRDEVVKLRDKALLTFSRYSG